MFNLLYHLQSVSLIWTSGRIPAASLLFSGSFNNLTSITEHGPRLVLCWVLWKTGHPILLFTAENRLLYRHHFVLQLNRQLLCLKASVQLPLLFSISGCPSKDFYFYFFLANYWLFTLWETSGFWTGIRRWFILCSSCLAVVGAYRELYLWKEILCSLLQNVSKLISAIRFTSLLV